MFGIQKKGTKKNEIIQMITDLEIQPFVPKEGTDLVEYTKIPLQNIGALSVAFEPLMKGLQDIGSPKGGSGIYRVDVPKGSYMQRLKSGEFFGATVKKGSTTFSGQAKLTPVSGGVPPVNPVMICIALVLLSVNKKLEQINDNQQAILAFLEEKERAKMEGNLEILADVFNNYKYNWDNSIYKTNKHLQVQEIKRDSEQNIKFYRSQIEKKLEKKAFFHGDRSVAAKMQETEKIYKNYQLALYVYAFAYFLEVLLFENFESDYLDNIIKSIDKHCLEYKELYHNAYESLETYSQTSIQTRAVKVLSGLSRGTGKVVAKIPLINKSQMDENLIDAGNRLGQAGTEKTETTMKKLFDGETEFVNPFLDNLSTVKKLYNEPLELLVDNEHLYVKGV